MFGAITTDQQPFGSHSRDLAMERRWSMNYGHTETAPNCPRCASSNTKFCYYNNYSQSQPRYFCKGCRRYWTKGGSLRNVPVGGGCRKSRKSKSARMAADQRQGLSYQMPSPGSTNSTDDSNVISAANIDLAAVFANYLNPADCSITDNDAAVVETGDDDHEVNVNGNTNVDQESSNSSGVSYSASLEFPPNNCFDAENHHLENLLPYDPNIFQDYDALNLQAILGDEEICGEEMLPNFGQWQSIMQYQDFGSSFSSDQLAADFKNIATNSMESWSAAASYHLSSAEYNQIFPTHDDHHHHWNGYN